MSDGPELTADDVQEILRLVDDSRFDEFELETPRFSIRFRRDRVEPAASEAPAPPARPRHKLVEVTSPMVGSVFHAPSPGAAPYVEIGSRVEPATQLCIIEVMKLMNAVTAGVSGIVVEVCVENAAPVQYGDVLFRIDADG
ncbi:MAG TPA: biotin/lipoyl-containing protein [Gaiellaceae bacterium]